MRRACIFGLDVDILVFAVKECYGPVGGFVNRGSPLASTLRGRPLAKAGSCRTTEERAGSHRRGPLARPVQCMVLQLRMTTGSSTGTPLYFSCLGVIFMLETPFRNCVYHV